MTSEIEWECFIIFLLELSRAITKVYLKKRVDFVFLFQTFFSLELYLETWCRFLELSTVDESNTEANPCKPHTAEETRKISKYSIQGSSLS